MNRAFWTTLILAAGVCAIVMLALAAHNKRLSEQIATEQRATGQGQSQGRGQGQGQGQGPQRKTPNRVIKSTRTPTSSLSSVEKIERASEGVTRFTASLVPAEGSRAKELAKGTTLFSGGGNEESTGRRLMFWENLPDLLRTVEGLSVDELLAVAADVPKGDETLDQAIDTRIHLIMLAAEQDPRRVLQDEKLMEGIDKLAVLRRLAIVDPAEAMRLLPEVVPPGEMAYKDKRERLGALMLGSDVDLGLQLLLEMRESDPDKGDGMISLTGGLGMGSTPLRPEAIPELVEAISNPKFGAIRNSIIKTTLDHFLSESGVGKAARQAKAMSLTPEEIELYLDSVGEALIATSPESTVEWMADALTAEQRSREIPEAIVAWANRDVEAASAWLARQKPSPVLDRTIARFATEASTLDPEAAEIWAKQIQGEQLQEEILSDLESR